MPPIRVERQLLPTDRIGSEERFQQIVVLFGCERRLGDISPLKRKTVQTLLAILLALRGSKPPEKSKPAVQAPQARVGMEATPTASSSQGGFRTYERGSIKVFESCSSQQHPDCQSQTHIRYVATAPSLSALPGAWSQWPGLDDSCPFFDFKLPISRTNSRYSGTARMNQY